MRRVTHRILSPFFTSSLAHHLPSSSLSLQAAALLASGKISVLCEEFEKRKESVYEECVSGKKGSQ